MLFFPGLTTAALAPQLFPPHVEFTGSPACAATTVPCCACCAACCWRRAFSAAARLATSAARLASRSWISFNDKDFLDSSFFWAQGAVRAGEIAGKAGTASTAGGDSIGGGG